MREHTRQNDLYHSFPPWANSNNGPVGEQQRLHMGMGGMGSAPQQPSSSCSARSCKHSAASIWRAAPRTSAARFGLTHSNGPGPCRPLQDVPAAEADNHGCDTAKGPPRCRPLRYVPAAEADNHGREAAKGPPRCCGARSRKQPRANLWGNGALQSVCWQTGFFVSLRNRAGRGAYNKEGNSAGR